MIRRFIQFTVHYFSLLPPLALAYIVSFSCMSVLVKVYKLTAINSNFLGYLYTIAFAKTSGK